jgi:microcystin-dependent protein
MAAYLGEIILMAANFAPAGYARCDGQLLAIQENEALFYLIGTTFGGDGEETFAVPDLRGRVPVHQGTSGGQTYFLGEMGGHEDVTLLATQLPVHTHAISVTSMAAVFRCKNGPATTTSPVGAVPAIETVGPYTDPSLTVIPPVMAKAAHVTELRTRIDGARAVNGLAPFAYTDPALSPTATTIRAQHILDLRTALSQVYAQLGLTPPAYTDPQLTSGTTMKAVHISELRTAASAVAASATALRYSNAAPDSNMHSSAIAMSGSPAALATGGTQPHNNMQPFLGLNYCISLFGIFPSQT